MSIVTIVGSGMMGSALAFPARENGHEVRLVGTHLDAEIIDACIKTGRHPKFDRDFPAGVKYYKIEQLPAALKGADLVIGGVSSFGVDWFGEKVLPLVPENTPVLSVTKGLLDDENGGLKCYPHLWRDRLAAAGMKRVLCAVGGPCTSYELVAHDQTVVWFCGDDLSVLERIRAIMQTDYYHVALSTDVVGVESAVALKNAYALGVALTIGVNRRREGEDSPMHYNSQAAAFGQGVAEMRKLLRLLGGGDDNIVVGAGDLYVTVFGGRTRQLGILLGEGLGFDRAIEKLKGITLESVVVITRVARAIRKLASLGKLDAADFPLLMHVDSVLNSSAPVNIPWNSFTR